MVRNFLLYKALSKKNKFDNKAVELSYSKGLIKMVF